LPARAKRGRRRKDVRKQLLAVAQPLESQPPRPLGFKNVDKRAAQAAIRKWRGRNVLDLSQSLGGREQTRVGPCAISNDS
jgi:hypothetical protein